MRTLFCAPEGKKFVGYDASGLELRMLAHYMNDQEFTRQVLHGDIHSYNQRLAGLPTRDAAKTFIYAFIYGAGDAKLGSIVNGPASEGAKLRDRFLSALPKLGELIDKVKKASRRGYLLGLDGRKVYMRRDSRGDVMEHKALNTLLQSAGAIVMKKSLQLLTVAANDIDYIKVIDMHDEGQCEVIPEQAQLFGELAVQSIRDAGKHFNSNIPLDGEYKVGTNWAETH
jgi:DNA polymerase I-like protein with 3'-5' exonuclease and polymerase domains